MPRPRLIRYVLEVRLKNRLFSFSDFRGSMVDHLIEKADFEQIKLSGNGARIDLKNSKKDKFYFVSIENFGLQSEANTDFESFQNQAAELIEKIKSFEKYSIGGGLA